MSSSIFGNMNPIANAVEMAKKLTRGNATQAYRELYDSNAGFREFIKQNKGKSPEQVCRDNGIDINQIRQFL